MGAIQLKGSSPFQPFDVPSGFPEEEEGTTTQQIA